MARVLIAWELGSGLGHVVPLADLARALVGAGHRVDVALAFLDHGLAGYFEGLGVRILPAPFWRPRPPSGSPLSYPDVLLKVGYDDPIALAGRLRAWRALFDLSEPEVLIAHASPTALIAAREHAITKIAWGDGYSVLPRRSPSPALRAWVPAEPGQLEQVEQRALAAIEQGLAQAGLGEHRQASLADLCAVDHAVLRTCRELDHHAEREPGAIYVGPAFSLDSGVPPRWPSGPGARILIYLPASSPYLPALARGLRGVRASVSAFIPGLSSKQRRALTMPHVHLAPEPISLGPALEQASLTICHGGAGTVAASLAAGVPLLLLPDNLERFMTTFRVRQLGAGVSPKQSSQGIDLASTIRAALGDEQLRDRAQRFASTYAAGLPADPHGSTLSAIGGS